MSKELIRNFHHNNGEIVFGTDLGRVCLLNAHTGEIIWEKQLTPLDNTRSPIIHKDIVYTGGHGGGKGIKLVSSFGCSALNKADGELLWQEEVNGAFWKPTVEDDVVYTSSSNAHVYAFEASSGRKLWSLNVENSPNSSTIPFFDNLLFISTKKKLSLDDPKKKAAILGIDRGTGTLVWSFQNTAFWEYFVPKIFRGNTDFNYPTVHNGMVFAGSSAAGGEGQLFALNAKDGSLLWTFGAKATWGLNYQVAEGDTIYVNVQRDGRLCVLDVNTGTLRKTIKIREAYQVVLCDGLLYYGSLCGHLVVLDPETENIKWEKNFGEKIFDPPQITHDTVFLRIQNKIYALNKEDGELKWLYEHIPLERSEDE